MKLYTTLACGPCQRVKQFIKENDLEVEMVDEIIAFPSDVRSVPTLEVDGKYIVGDTQVIKKLRETKDAEEVTEEP